MAPLSLGRRFRIRVSDMNYVYRQLISSENVLKLLIGQPSGCQCLQHREGESKGEREGEESENFGALRQATAIKMSTTCQENFSATLQQVQQRATLRSAKLHCPLPLSLCYCSPLCTLSNFRLRTRRLAGAKQTGPPSHVTYTTRCTRTARSAFNENNETETEACR